MERYSKLIITAASKGYAESLFALIGSINVNWPKHPPVLVYDIGLNEEALNKLQNHQIPVRKVPAFCPHWRKHYTWKLWCWNDAPADHVLWMDAGVAVLSPLDEVFESIKQLGYFAVPSNFELTEHAHLDACRGCGVPPESRNGRIALAGTLVGMDKSGTMSALISEALSVAQDECCIASTEEIFNTDQAIYSLLMYKYFKSVVIADKATYLGELSPKQTPCQKVWVHRRGILPEDIEYYSRYMSTPGLPYRPQIPVDGIMWFIRRPRRVLTKTREKGLIEASHLALRFVLGQIGLRRESRYRVRNGLRD
jgi:hypothetical protein